MLPDVVTYSALISACEKEEHSGRSMTLFEAMKQQGVVPNFISHSALISACEKGKQPERALELKGVMPNALFGACLRRFWDLFEECLGHV